MISTRAHHAPFGLIERILRGTVPDHIGTCSLERVAELVPTLTRAHPSFCERLVRLLEHLWPVGIARTCAVRVDVWNGCANEW